LKAAADGAETKAALIQLLNISEENLKIYIEDSAASSGNGEKLSTLYYEDSMVQVVRDAMKLASAEGIPDRIQPGLLSHFHLIAALAMIGIPPLNGFLSKWTLALGALDANMPFYVLVLLISSLLNALYYLPIIIPAFFELPGDMKPDHDDEHDIKFDIQEASPGMLTTMIILAACTFFFGLTPNNIAYALSRLSAAFLLLGGNL